MEKFVVLKSGLYAMQINGREEVAHRTMVVGIYDTSEEANRMMTTTEPAEEGNWRGVTFAWVDTAVVGAPPIWN